MSGGAPMTCGTCGRETWRSAYLRRGDGGEQTAVCCDINGVDCWRARAERLLAERDAAVGLLRRHHSPGTEWQDQPGLHRETEELLARIDAAKEPTT
jgi:hypothetical protein